MAPMAAKKGSRKKATRRKVPARKRLEPRQAKRGLQGAELLLDLQASDVAPLVDQVRDAGGAAIGAYREPLSGRPILLASLPIRVDSPGPAVRWVAPSLAS